ncbi:nuclear factor interleukin-3-regulated protein-like [Palaemon carinicauda]|uniref:nuclear factor interleukin-3-regulated protein-like n=1 Tax=Palaemon carinicauda TaxID=392227 RepID=UPI0035B6117B
MDRIMDSNPTAKRSTEHLLGSKRSLSESQAFSNFSSDSPKKNFLIRSASVIAAVSTSPSEDYADSQKGVGTSSLPLLPLLSPITLKSEPTSPRRSPSEQMDMGRFSPPKKRAKRHSISFPMKQKLPSPVRICSTDKEVVDLTQVKEVQDHPEDLSRPRSTLASRRTPPPPYPVELQIDIKKVKKTFIGETVKENIRGDNTGIEKERNNDFKRSISSSSEILPIVNDKNILDVLQRQIMVAETVKYPVNYPALIPLSPSVAGLGGYSCSSSMLHPNFSPAHIMEQKPQQQQLSPQGPPMDSPHHNGQDNTPVGLGAPGLHLPSSLDLASHIRKKDIFTQRKQREFIPDSKKDESYWDRRRRNNEAAKRSREKRRFNDMILEQRVIELSKENHIMKAQLNAIKEKYGIMGENLINVDQVIANMPQTDQIIALNKRTKFNSNIMNVGSSSPLALLSPDGSMTSPTPTPTFHNNDNPESPQDYSHYGNTHDDHDSHFDNTEQYPPSSSSDLYYRSSAINLSTHTSNSHSPLSPATSQMEYSPASDPEICRRSPVGEAGSSLPHKLRHKSHLGDKDAAQSLLALQGIKAEPHDPHQEAAEDSVGSSDERDSGISYSSSSSCSDGYPRSSDTSSSSPTNCLMGDSPSISRNQQSLHMQHYQHQQEQHQKQDSDDVAEYENTQLRSELERLASEVATLKYMLVRRPRSEGDSDGSR